VKRVDKSAAIGNKRKPEDGKEEEDSKVRKMRGQNP
jgi:hypothetical protein